MMLPSSWWLRDPACWRWKLPTDAFIERLRKEWEPSTEERLRWIVMCEWQDERCAVCGRRPQRLLTDHDHDTGLIRGFLCSSCNTSEGFSRGDEDTIFSKYRERPPAATCGVREIYVSSWSY